MPDDPIECVNTLRTLLHDAVRLRLRADVRVGTCLSGGLDSSSIATLAAELRHDRSVPFVAVTAVSEQPDNSEEDYARRVVEGAGLDWIRVRPE